MLRQPFQTWQLSAFPDSKSFDVDPPSSNLEMPTNLQTILSPVLKICFGPPTAESKNLKNHVNFGVGDLFFRSPALWSSQNVFGPPTASCVVVDFKDRAVSDIQLPEFESRTDKAIITDGPDQKLEITEKTQLLKEGGHDFFCVRTFISNL